MKVLKIVDEILLVSFYHWVMQKSSVRIYHHRFPWIKKKDGRLLRLLVKRINRIFCQTFRNIEELEAKIYFTDHQTVKKIQLFVANKRKIFTSILLNNVVKRKSPE